MESEAIVSPILAGASLAVVFAVILSTAVAELPSGERVRVILDQHAQKLMLLIAGTAMFGSLYYSEIVEFIPCEFCWFQRIAMYPLAILLFVALVTRSRLEPKYIITLAAIGLSLSIYHYQLQLFPEQGEVCSGVVSCTDRNVEEFGIVSIPFMAGAGFLSILLLQWAEWRVDVLYRRWAQGEPEAIAMQDAVAL